MTQKLLGGRNPGLLFVVSAPAGTGKTTLVHMLSQEFPCVVESVSFTTRQPRPGEVEGVHYHFISTDAFEKKVSQGDFLEYVKLYNCYYGTSKMWVKEKLSEGKHVILVIDTQGGMQIMDKVDAIYIFIKPPSLKELRKRLTERKTETAEAIEARLEWAKHEIEVGKLYEYHITNENLEIAYQILRSILIAEEHRKN